MSILVKSFANPLESRQSVKSDVGATCRGAVAEAQSHQPSSRHGSAQPTTGDNMDEHPSQDTMTSLDPPVRQASFVT